MVIHPDVNVGLEEEEKGEKQEKGEKPGNSPHKSKYDKIFDIESEEDETEKKDEKPYKKVEAPVVPIVNIPKETISRLLKDIKDTDSMGGFITKAHTLKSDAYKNNIPDNFTFSLSDENGDPIQFGSEYQA